MPNIISEKKFIFDIPAGKKKERIDVYLSNSIENASRSRIQKLIKAELVFVNGKPVKSNYILHGLEKVEVIIPISPRPDKAEPEDIPINIVYEDENLIVVNKPPGIVVHPSFGHYSGTLVNALLHHSRQLSGLNEPGRPGIVHRIDKDTSGLLIVAKDDVTHAKLAKQFSQHIIQREYWAVAWGILKKKNGEIDFNITRSKSDRKKFAVSQTLGKTALTFYEVIEEFEFASLIRLKLKTGRTHQIRVHMSAIGHPIFGDETYGGRKIVYGNQFPKIKSRIENLLEIMQRQALHAKTLGFFHPIKQEMMKFDSELPDDFKKLLTGLRGK
jgi:23S rRNA pseudouridine1911/1915/1917 synthase